MNTENILIRASSVGKIMTNPKTGTGLSETTKTYLRELFISLKYGRKKDIINRAVTKGLLVEEDSLTIYSRLRKEMLYKNEDRFENEFICGTPDVILKDEIIDVKSSYDIFTFFTKKYENVDKNYYYQLQSYMALTGAKISTLAYCLVNMPEVMINDQKRRLAWQMNLIDPNGNKDYESACEEIDTLSIYDDIDLKDRCIEIQIGRDEEAIQRIYDRVTECRKYIATL